MINLKKACVLATVGAMLAPAAFAGPYKEVVHNTFGNPVVNTFGNCVITKWDATTNKCGRNLRSMAKEMRTVYFDFNKSTLNSKEKAKLDDLSKVVLSSKEVESVDIVGYADKIGDANYNKRLSTKRAETVKAYLASKGLKTRKVRLQGKGESEPVTNCNHADRKEQIACLAEDRRAEIEFNFIK